MKFVAGLISLAAILVAMSLPAATSAQMMQGGMMGGGRHGMINLASPADSPTQIRRGTIAIASYMSGMMGSGIGGPNRSKTPGVRVTLRLHGVTDTNGLVTSTGNHLIFEGELTTPTDSRAPISIDQLFALNAGSASVQVPISLSSVTGPATITIDRIAVQDASDNAFAVPGVALVQPILQATPGPTPGRSCTSDNDCNDGDPNTQDECTPMGCRHMPGHMGPGGGPMM